MEYVRLSGTDLKVSRLAIGGMSFGDATKGKQDWVLSYPRTREVLAEAFSLGYNFIDTANCYAEGTSEEYIGRALKELGIPREKVVLQSKVYYNPGKLSKAAIEREIDGSLSRLQTSYLDVYVLHRFDYATPIEETLGALEDLYKAGKIRYLGASSMYPEQFQAYLDQAKSYSLPPFVEMQDSRNLIYREEEKAMIPLLKLIGIQEVVYSPLAAGRLARPWSSDTKRYKDDPVARAKFDSFREQDAPVLNEVGRLAAKYHVSYSAIALAWLLSKKEVASLLIGATKEKHLQEATQAFEVSLTEEDIQGLEKNYRPHPLIGVIPPPSSAK